jgi:uncharacterized protein (DUF1499 family)
MTSETFTDPLRWRHCFLIALLVSAAACSSRTPQLGASSGRLAPCPASPNCVSSDADDEAHRIPSLQLVGSAATAWPLVRAAVAEMPRTRLVTEAPGYLHAECRSAIFGFVDDLELYLRPDHRSLAVRSASRRGYSDLGVNRRRIETLCATLAARGIVSSCR